MWELLGKLAVIETANVTQYVRRPSKGVEFS
jgi:hypothetical protein